MSEDIDDRYRRESAADPSRPSDSVRQAVMAHASRVAAVSRESRKTRNQRRGAFGLLAAAALAGFLVIPRFSKPPTPALALQHAPEPAAARPIASAPEPAAPPAIAPSPHARGANLPAPNETLAQAQAPLESRAAILAHRSNAMIAPAPDAYSPARDVAAGKNPAVAEARQALTQSSAAARNSASASASASPSAASVVGGIGTMDALNAQTADIDARDENGRTPLMLAVLNRQDAAVDVLLARGADPNAADAGGTRPLQAAEAMGQSKIAAALRRAGAR